MCILKGEVPDRSAVKLWGLEPGQEMLAPEYAAVYELAMECSDLMPYGQVPFDAYWGVHCDSRMRSFERDRGDDEWVDVVTQIDTPGGVLEGVFRKSKLGNPGYQEVYMVTRPEQIQELLTIPFEPMVFDGNKYLEMEHKVGDRGVTVMLLDHAGHGLERLIGSENMALWSIDHRDLLLEAVATFAGRIRGVVEGAFEAGLKPVFGWCGPELFMPPLMGPQDFEDFVFEFDKPLIDLIHEGGGHAWVHCHGKMNDVLPRFVEMGVDLLNPIEPPPMGDVTMAEAFDRVGDDMGLEGGVQIHDLMVMDSDEVAAMVRATKAGGEGRRFVLGTCSGYMEWPRPEPRMIENMLTYLREAVV